jgi:hypothetical protein
MTKLTIEIEDLRDVEQCSAALQKLVAALVAHHGELFAAFLLTHHGEREGRKLYYTPGPEEMKLIYALDGLSWADQECLLEYLASGLSKKKFVNGRSAIKSRLQRIYAAYPDACRTVEAISPELRTEQLRIVKQDIWFDRGGANCWDLSLFLCIEALQRSVRGSACNFV